MKYFEFDDTYEQPPIRDTLVKVGIASIHLDIDFKKDMNTYETIELTNVHYLTHDIDANSESLYIEVTAIHPEDLITLREAARNQSPFKIDYTEIWKDKNNKHHFLFEPARYFSEFELTDRIDDGKYEVHLSFS